MGKAGFEIQNIVSHLTFIYWCNTDSSTGLTHKPYGNDWVTFERNVYRLLVLRGTINMGDKIQEDPWELFLNEYAPVNTRRPACEKYQSSSLSSYQSYPNSILLAPSTGQQQSTRQNAQSAQQGDHCAGEQSQQQQQGTQSECRVRFTDTPSPNRSRTSRRGPPRPAPQHESR